MMKLSTGQDSTLGSYRDLCTVFFGEGSAQVRFLDEKINKQGRDEEVVSEESQMMYLLFNLPPEDSPEMAELLA